MWLIVGLGNPGKQYALTRHNIGFMALDFLGQGLGMSSWSTEHKAEVVRGKIGTIPVIFAKPQTYMNKSGESVIPLLQYYKIPKEQMIVVQDDIDQPLLSMRFQQNRGHGGHNGIRSITEQLGTADYIRLKLGVGRPPHPEMDVADYVLGKFATEEQGPLRDFLNRAGDALETCVQSGLGKAATLYNGLKNDLKTEG
jgi:PTH1 family peptidyl-tRNA hydrolase